MAWLIFRILIIVVASNLFNKEMNQGRQYRNFERQRKVMIDSLITMSAREAEINDSILRMDVKN